MTKEEDDCSSVHVLDTPADDTEASILAFIASSDGARLADTNPKVFAVLASALNNNLKLNPLINGCYAAPLSFDKSPVYAGRGAGATPRSWSGSARRWLSSVLPDAEKRRRILLGVAFSLAFVFLAVFRDLVYQVSQSIELIINQ
jgi:hypothetical protein